MLLHTDGNYTIVPFPLVKSSVGFMVVMVTRKINEPIKLQIKWQIVGFKFRRQCDVFSFCVILIRNVRPPKLFRLILSAPNPYTNKMLKNDNGQKPYKILTPLDYLRDPSIVLNDSMWMPRPAWRTL